MRRRVLIGNWKMHKTAGEAGTYISEFLPLIQSVTTVDIIIAPPFTALHVVAESIKDTAIGLAGQDVHWDPQGAFTGEVSPAMLCDSGCQSVIIGHSERRQMFHEDDHAVNRKVKAAIAHHLTAIMCVGETREERDTGKTSDVLSRQLMAGLAGIDTIDDTQLILAYEPIWAIGSGTPARPHKPARCTPSLGRTSKRSSHPQPQHPFESSTEAASPPKTFKPFWPCHTSMGD